MSQINLDTLKQIIDKYAPVIYFHSKEQYLMCSPDQYLDCVELFDKDGKVEGDVKSLIANLPAPSGDEGNRKYWLKIVDNSSCSNIKSGNLDDAEVYVRAKLANNSLWLQYFFFYAYNGPGTLVLEVDVKPSIGGIKSFDGSLSLEPLGEHEGDWEHITVVVDPNASELQKVYMSEHSGGAWVEKKDLEKEKGHPVVFSSRNGHASYCGVGTNMSHPQSKIFKVKIAKVLVPVTVSGGLRNDTNYGIKFDSTGKCRLIAVSDMPGITLRSEDIPTWYNYAYRWGAKLEYDCTEELKNVIPPIPHLRDKIIEWIASILPAEMKGEIGPTGPSQKEWESDC